MISVHIILLLSLIQGSAEFLPISSAGHLLLAEKWLNLPYNTLTFDISLNVGTLLTTMIYFRKEICIMLMEIKHILTFKVNNYRKLLVFKLTIATIPVIIIGYFIVYFDVLNSLRNNHILLAINLIVFGIILYISDIYSKNTTNFNNISMFQSFVIGVIQCIALIPGVSRSGCTITAARLQNIKRTDAVKFSFLLAMPSTLGAIILTTLNAFNQHIAFQYMDILLGIVCSFLFGLIFIHILLKFITKHNFMIFMIYRIIIGILILIFMK